VTALSGGARGRLRLAVTLGDPRGIGPEVAAEAARRLGESDPTIDLIFIGPSGTRAESAAAAFESVGAWSTGNAAEAGRLAGLAIERGVRLTLEGAVDALVTAPIDKAALHAAGWAEPGHTELLARLTDAADPVMMLCAESTQVGGALRVVLATTHHALRDVPALFTRERLVRQTRATHEGLRTLWEMRAPRLALCAFNPHASDGGRFGTEESILYLPALEELRSEGIEATGPIPADTVFVRALRGEFDAVIAPYHDVGMAAFKTVAFGRGVNVTLGLPIIRTSPDHGTALDIAGRGLADASSMLEAMRLAVALAARRNAALTRA
jgi:4-hydroxythreonine-4-phosphate dehydrogenase